MEPNSTIPTIDAEECRRTFWTFYLLDRLVSCSRAKPPAILEGSCLLQLPCDEALWAAGQAIKTQRLENLASRDLLEPAEVTPFAVVVLASYVLSRCAQYMLQDYNIRSKELLWSPQSDHTSIAGDLAYLESHFDMDCGTEHMMTKICQGASTIDQSRAGPMVFARALVYLGRCLLHHPFLLRRRLLACNVTAPAKFLSRSFDLCRTYAVQLTQLMSEASRAGCIVLTSFYGYSAVVAGGIHVLNTHNQQAHIAEEAGLNLSICEVLLDTVSTYWVNVGSMQEALRVFSAHGFDYCFLNDVSHTELALSAEAMETLWSVVDYSAMSSISHPKPPVTTNLFDVSNNNQWFDLFNSAGYLDNETLPGLRETNG
ncbi:hypothetical protein LTS14_005002 [Recurvomyces mirabilis]|nr:hypothetical protein LTS14_005002 [Recurvomyces mirabilis]